MHVIFYPEIYQCVFSSYLILISFLFFAWRIHCCTIGFSSTRVCVSIRKIVTYMLRLGLLVITPTSLLTLVLLFTPLYISRCPLFIYGCPRLLFLWLKYLIFCFFPYSSLLYAYVRSLVLCSLQLMYILHITCSRSQSAEIQQALFLLIYC